MRADLERFAIETLIGDPPRGAAPGAPARLLVQVPDLADVPAHWHDYHELGYVLDGTAQHVVNGARESLRPGSAFLLSPVDLHGIEVPPGRTLRCLNVVLAPALVKETFQSVVPGADDELPWATDLSDLEDDAVRVQEEVERRPPGWALVVESTVRRMLVELARRCSPAAGAGVPVRPEVSDDLSRAVRHVERHFREPLTLAEVAAVAHLSPHWFSEQFRVETGSSFQAYLKSRRLQFARALLQATDLSVTDVCHAAGFNDLSWFGRAYRTRYGEPPSRDR